MAQPQLARITCRECNGWYASESELRDHMQMVHRRFVSERSTVPPAGTQSDSPEHQLDTSRAKWAEISVRLRNGVQAQFKPEELDAIDRFILLASQGSIFDHLRDSRDPR